MPVAKRYNYRQETHIRIINTVVIKTQYSACSKQASFDACGIKYDMAQTTNNY
jgi:hypothetical protein